jgi:hypothetical protein
MSGRPLRRPPRLTNSLPRQPFPRSNSSRWLGAKGQDGKICAAGESFATRVAVFAWIAKSRVNPGSTATKHKPIDQFLAGPCTVSTGARKPFGGSVSHSRSGSGPRAVSDLPPIPTHFSGLRLFSTDELDPQLLWHLTVCPSGSTERMVTGSPAGNPCV